jgi:hypothetical protein
VIKFNSKKLLFVTFSRCWDLGYNEGIEESSFAGNVAEVPINRKSPEVLDPGG